MAATARFVSSPRGGQPSLRQSEPVQTLLACEPAGHAGRSGLHRASALAEQTDAGDHWRVIRTATIVDGRTQRARRASHVLWPIGSDRIWHFGQHPCGHPATIPPPRAPVVPSRTQRTSRAHGRAGPVLVPTCARFRHSDPVSIDKDRGSPLAARWGEQGNRLECGFSRGSVVVIPRAGRSNGFVALANRTRILARHAVRCGMACGC